MSIEHGIDIAKTPEVKEKYEVTYLGRLADFGLGSPEGIPSKLAEASDKEICDYGQELLRFTAEVTDFSHDRCIDGRCVVCNVDESEAEVRERFVGGSAANVEVALNASAPIVDGLSYAIELADVLDTVDAYVEQKSGKKRAAHTGNCGGANGAIIHNELIGTEPGVLGAAKAIMNLPQVHAVTAMTYDEAAGESVRVQAPKTASWLREKGWEGQNYVDMAAKQEPSGVEVLQTADDPYHGHAEDALVIDAREGVVIHKDDVFVVSVAAIRKKAEALAGDPGSAEYMSRYSRALVAGFAKHTAVAKVLPSEETPVLLVA